MKHLKIFKYYIKLYVVSSKKNLEIFKYYIYVSTVELKILININILPPKT